MDFTYKTFGSRFYGGQIDRIDQGFNMIGGVSDEINPDFIYCNDGGFYDEAIKFKKEISPKSTLILNVLDVPSMYIGINFDLGKMYEQLKQADIVTCISKFVQGQIEHYFNIYASIVYNPIKDITNKQRENGIRKYPFRAMMVGRVNDRFKRGSLAIQSLIMAGFEEKDVVIVGSENPNWGTYLGVVNDEKLNDLYNSVDFVMMCSQFEGMGLPGLEAQAAGAIPIVCSDLTTVSEFYYHCLWNHPSPQCISLFLRRLTDNPELMKKYKSYSSPYSQFRKEDIATNILLSYQYPDA
jgi:glycosyltransferase involved in cell wall biosynthesis